MLLRCNNNKKIFDTLFLMYKKKYSNYLKKYNLLTKTKNQMER